MRNTQIAARQSCGKTAPHDHIAPMVVKPHAAMRGYANEIGVNGQVHAFGNGSGVFMSRRIDKSWVVLASLEAEDGLRCIDLFRRPDGTFGYEEFRRDPEDQGAWTPVRFASGLSYASLEQARTSAEAAVVWLGEVTRQ